MIATSRRPDSQVLYFLVKIIESDIILPLGLDVTRQH